MFKAIRRAAAGWRRRRRLNQIRGVFARCGYPVDHLNDSKIVAALTRGGECRIEEVPLSAKTVYFAVRRLSSEGGGGHFHKRKTERATQIQKA